MAIKNFEKFQELAKQCNKLNESEGSYVCPMKIETFVYFLK